jgi:chemotaxis protein methyltransferase WspC
VTATDLRSFVRLLEDRIGLDAASIGHDEVGRAVRSRMLGPARRRTDAIEPGRLRSYLGRLVNEPEEWDEFVEHVLVPETWFFREPSAFDLLTRVAAERVRAGRPCRVLSVPCATGEEPYSMAIALHEARLTSGRPSIEALDISRRALDAAARGVYGPRAVRYVGAPRLARYFRASDEGQVIDAGIRAMVSLEWGNLINEAAIVPRGPYDVIFCRNVLIYFTAAARARVLATLDAALADDGWLVTGHAEGGAVVAPRFVSARVPRTFAYRKALLGAGDASRVPVVGEPTAAGASARAGIGAPPTSTVAAMAPTQAAASPGLPPLPDLADVERVADAGDLSGAAALCRRHLATRPGSAQGYYLLGVIESARGHHDASEAALQRAVYLDPSHEAALRHLASERRRAGDLREAQQFMRRADLVRARRK